jgi:cold shock CspA family protein
MAYGKIKADTLVYDNSGNDVDISISTIQRAGITTLTDAATVTPNLNDSNNFDLTLGGNRTIANPTNLNVGQSGTIFISQDSTGNRTATWGSHWDWVGGTAPTLSTGANKTDRVDYIVRNSSSIFATATLDYS